MAGILNVSVEHRDRGGKTHSLNGENSIGPMPSGMMLEMHNEFRIVEPTS
jgi:hypothetical protein